MRHYEIVFIVHPDQSEQVPAMVERYRTLVTSKNGHIHRLEDWGRRQLAYPIQKKNTGFYYLIEFRSDGSNIGKLELEYKRDERVMRFLTVSLDKHAVTYNEKKRKNAAIKKKEEETLTQN